VYFIGEHMMDIEIEQVKMTRLDRIKAKRVDRNRTDFFTIQEEAFLKSLKRYKGVKEVATDLGIGYVTAVRRLNNIRNKWEKSTNTHNRLLALCKGDQPVRRLLSKPVKRIPVMNEDPNYQSAPTSKEDYDDLQEPSISFVESEDKWKT